MDCIFCKIVQKEIPSDIVMEDPNFIAIYDIKPISEGHTLVIPKKHIDNFTELVKKNSTYITELFRFVEKVRQHLLEKHNPKAIYIRVNNESLLDVIHLHVHLVPVY